MNGEGFNKLVKNFDPHDKTLVSKMALLIEKYPYFQLPRFFYTKSLKDQNTEDFEKALNQLALYTFDRGVLKHKIESTLEYPKKSEDSATESGDPIKDEQITSFDSKADEQPIKKITKTFKENVVTEKSEKTSPRIQALYIPKEEFQGKKSLSVEKKYTEDNFFSLPPENLRLSFTDWIDFTGKKQPIEAIRDETEEPLSDKLIIIDRFISKDPKISPVGKTEIINSVLKKDFYSDELMTETLAKLLVKQKKYKKAISAYTILSLKYPEKNVFFAGQIQIIKKLQQQ